MNTIYSQIKDTVREGVSNYTWRGYSKITGVAMSILRRLASDDDDARKHTELLTLLKIFPEATISLGEPITMDDSIDAGKVAKAQARDNGTDEAIASLLSRLEKAVRESDTITDKLPVLSLLLQAALGKL